MLPVVYRFIFPCFKVFGLQFLMFLLLPYRCLYRFLFPTEFLKIYVQLFNLLSHSLDRFVWVHLHAQKLLLFLLDLLAILIKDSFSLLHLLCHLSQRLVFRQLIELHTCNFFHLTTISSDVRKLSLFDFQCILGHHFIEFLYDLERANVVFKVDLNELRVKYWQRLHQQGRHL